MVVIPAQGEAGNLWASMASLLKQSSEFQAIERCCLRKERGWGGKKERKKKGGWHIRNKS